MRARTPNGACSPRRSTDVLSAGSVIRVPHNRLTHGAEEVEAVTAVVDRGKWAAGPEAERLEAALAVVVGRRHAAVVGSGVGALRLALLALGVGVGDEVVVPAYCCVALANAVLACGAIPVTADVTPEAWVLDAASVAAVAGERTKAIIAVHTFGVPADIGALRAFGIPVIEDCAHGLGSAGMGHEADVAMTSFYATKLIGGGEGGAIMSDIEAVDGFVRGCRDYGDQAASAMRLNDKMSDLSASLARVQLGRLPEMVIRRAALAARYNKALAPLVNAGRLHLPPEKPGRIWYRYAVEVVEGAGKAWIDALRGRGIGTEFPVSDWRQPADGMRVQPAPAADRAYERVVSLPLYPSLSEQEQTMVIDAVHEASKALP